MEDKDKNEGIYSNDPVFEQFLKKEKLTVPSAVSPLFRLQRTLKYNIFLAVVLTVCYTVVMLYTPVWQVKATFVLMIGFCVWSLYDLINLYRGLQFEIVATNSVLAELKRQYYAIKRWMKVNQQVGLLIYPFSIAGGFIWGGVMGSGKNAEDFIFKPVILITLIICLIVLMPVCFYSARWMFKMMFGAQMDDLKDTIDAFERD